MEGAEGRESRMNTVEPGGCRGCDHQGQEYRREKSKRKIEEKMVINFLVMFRV